MRSYAKEYYLKVLKKALRNRKLNIKQISEKTGINRYTLSRWIDLFVAMGILKEEKKGKERYLYFEKKK
ncbi:hypothetical protein DRN73_09925 [Candidatus Pacearchaeota archaeon]|nr:MAG: hypothetical protein DRN73_09925 [Candidatus Pacearchaeota archaeon]